MYSEGGFLWPNCFFVPTWSVAFPLFQLLCFYFLLRLVYEVVPIAFVIICKCKTPDKNWIISLSPVKHVKKDERKYYEELLKYSRDHLMLYPYHLSDIMVKGLRITPFSYYTGIMEVSWQRTWAITGYLSGTLPTVTGSAHLSHIGHHS